MTVACCNVIISSRVPEPPDYNYGTLETLQQCLHNGVDDCESPSFSTIVITVTELGIVTPGLPVMVQIIHIFCYI